MPFPAGSGAADPPARLLYDRAANYGSIIVWKYLKLHIQFSRVAGMKSSLYFTASSLVSTIKSVRRRISLAHSDSQKVKENGNAYQPEEKTVKKNRCCMVCWLPCSSGLCCGYSVDIV